MVRWTGRFESSSCWKSNHLLAPTKQADWKYWFSTWLPPRHPSPRDSFYDNLDGIVIQKSPEINQNTYFARPEWENLESEVTHKLTSLRSSCYPQVTYFDSFVTLLYNFFYFWWSHFLDQNRATFPLNRFELVKNILKNTPKPLKTLFLSVF